MGLFDTVTFRCLQCGSEIEHQTKAGKCQLDTFVGERGVPGSIAADVEGVDVQCSECRNIYEILSIIPLDRVPLRLMEIG